MQLFIVLLAGFLISFSGSLPVGNLNLTAMYIASKENLKQALLFSFGVIGAEMVSLLIVLWGVKQIAANELLLNSLGILSVAFLIILAFSSFISVKKHSEHKNKLIDNNINRLALGSLMSAVSPFHFPFWAGWSVYFFTTYHIETSLYSNTAFMIGAGTGTLAAFLLYMISGKKLSGFLTKNQRGFHCFMGVLFSVLAIAQVVKLVMLQS